MKKPLFFLLLTVASYTNAQQATFDVIAGLANYQGDLQSKRYTFTLAKPAVGVAFSYQLAPQFYARGGVISTKLEGDDKYQKQENLRLRNLRFHTNITEFNAGFQYMIFDLPTKKYSPYVFAGLAVFKFDPYYYDNKDTKYYLRPLTTEGQATSKYPDRSIYKTTQMAIPFGAGFRMVVNEKFDVGIELGARKLFTDYIDDVSTTYADYFTLKGARGQQAVDIAFRADELVPQNYPAGGTQRGSPRYKDWYYLTTFSVHYKFGGEPYTKGEGNGSVGKKYRKGAGCPRVRY